MKFLYYSIRVFIIFLVNVPFLVRSQNSGIRFESGLSWQQIIAKAKAENKYIFMDCYATWCGPCKWMSKNIFPDQAVGEYYNTHFVNVAVQMDKTSKDSQWVKDWYADADSIARLYKVSAFPTYLFFTPDGKIIHRFMGTTKDKTEFVALGEDALNPEKQYYTILEQCKAHQGDSAFLLAALQRALSLEDASGAAEIGDYYLDCLKDPMNRENIRIIKSLIQSSDKKYEKGFKIFLDNARKVDQVMGDSSYVENVLSSDIFASELTSVPQSDNSPVYWDKMKSDLKTRYPMMSAGLINKEEFLFKRNIMLELRNYLVKQDSSNIDWTAILNRFIKRYPGYDIMPIFLERKAKYYRDKKMWEASADAAYEWIRKYGDQLENFDKNQIAWQLIFLHSHNKKALREAAKWMNQIVDLKTGQPVNPEQPNYLDTYANLLYKMGDQNAATVWENKAIELQHKCESLQVVKDNKEYYLKQLKGFESNLEKIRDGLPTWETT